MSDNKEISGWRKEFKDAWFAANDTGLLPKKKVKELWETTERAADIAYKYIRNHIEARHHLSPVWVKASERLPGKVGKYWIRYTNYNGQQKTGSFYDGFKFPHHQSEVEWLDESFIEEKSSHKEQSNVTENIAGNEQIYKIPTGEHPSSLTGGKK